MLMTKTSGTFSRYSPPIVGVLLLTINNQQLKCFLSELCPYSYCYAIQVTFEPEPRRNYLRLLGYDTAELSKKVSCTLDFIIHLSLSPVFLFIGANLPLPPSLPPSHFLPVLNMVKDECLHPLLNPRRPGALPEALHPGGRGRAREGKGGEGGNITRRVRDKQHCSIVWIRGWYVHGREAEEGEGREGRWEEMGSWRKGEIGRGENTERGRRCLRCMQLHQTNCRATLYVQQKLFIIFGDHVT